MAESDVRKLLAPLTLRSDVPQDARDAIAEAIQGTPLSTDVWIYRAVVVILGLTVLGTVFGGLALVAVGHADPNMKLPDSIVAIGSAAVGALAGLLAPSPVTRGGQRASFGRICRSVAAAANVTNGYQLTSSYVGRVLKGEKPADIPVEQPTKFEL